MYLGSSELHTFKFCLAGHPLKVADGEAPPHCSIFLSVELGAFSLSPAFSSDESIALKSGCRLAARYRQVLEPSLEPMTK